MATDLQLQVAIMPDLHNLISPLFIHSHTTDTDWKSLCWRRSKLQVTLQVTNQLVTETSQILNILATIAIVHTRVPLYIC